MTQVGRVPPGRTPGGALPDALSGVDTATRDAAEGPDFPGCVGGIQGLDGAWTVAVSLDGRHASVASRAQVSSQVEVQCCSPGT